MNVAVTPKKTGLVLLWSKRGLYAIAVGILSYCAFVLTDTWVFQRQAGRDFDRMQLRPGLVPRPGVDSAGGLMGRLEIPRLGFSIIIAEGTGESTLRRAGGHIRGTALPGGAGNIGIAGHRDTFFRPLRNIREDDMITLTTLAGEYRYRVVSTKIVDPSDTDVLSSDGREILTLVTCHPFYFVGPAPNRFIVRAERVT